LNFSLNDIGKMEDRAISAGFLRGDISRLSIAIFFKNADNLKLEKSSRVGSARSIKSIWKLIWMMILY
jgi:hypothetical protein